MLEIAQKYAEKAKCSTNRTFGFVFSTVFALIALFPVIRGGTLRMWALALAAVFLLLALGAPSVLGPANRLWMKVGELLHYIVSPFSLAIVFYLSVLPTGLILRLFGKDPLRLRIDRNVESYWIRRDPSGPTAESFNNQF